MSDKQPQPSLNLKNRARILRELKALIRNDDQELAHVEADSLLVEYINDPEIVEAYSKVDKWYA